MHTNPISQFVHSMKQGVQGTEERGEQGHGPKRANHGQITSQLARSIASDRLFLNQMRPEQARQFVTDSVISSLFRNLDLPPVTVPEVTSNEDAANQIAAATEQAASQAPLAVEPAVAEVIAGAAPVAPADAPIVTTANAAEKQAEAAASTLADSDAQPDVLTEIRDLLSQIKDRLDTLKSDNDSHHGRREDDDDDHHGVGRSSFRAGYQAISSASSTSVEIKTADGDIVTIDIASSFQSETTRFGYRDGDNTLRGFERSMSRETSMQFHVEGDLDEDELKAINKVMDKLNGIAEDFYGGDLDKEVAKAMDLGVGMEEIAAVSMDLSFSHQVQGVRMYQQTDGGHHGQNAESATSRIASMIREIAETYSFTAENTSFAEPAMALSELLQGVLDVNPLVPDAEKAEDAAAPATGEQAAQEPLLKSLLEQVTTE